MFQSKHQDVEVSFDEESCRSRCAGKQREAEQPPHHTLSWQWHTVVMSTGICCSLIHSLPFDDPHNIIKIFLLVIFALELLIFITLCGWTGLRLVRSPSDRRLMIRDPTNVLYLGYYFSGAASLINTSLEIRDDWNIDGGNTLSVLWAFWWINSTMACLAAVFVAYIVFSKGCGQFDEISPTWVIPTLTLITSSSSGGLFANALAADQRSAPALLSAATSFALLFVGLSFSSVLAGAFLLRLYTHGTPQPSTVLSTFIAVSPFCQGGYAMLVNGQAVASLSGNSALDSLAGTIIHTMCMCSAYAFWCVGLAWVVVACVALGTRWSQLPPFGLCYWSLVMPNGVFALLTLQLGVALDSKFFRVFGTAWAAFVFVAWVGVFGRTVFAVVSGLVSSPPSTAVESFSAAHCRGTEKFDLDRKLDDAEGVLPVDFDARSMVETLC